MAELGEAVVLVPPGSSRIIGASVGLGEHELACSTKAGIVSVYNVMDRRCHLSMSVKPHNTTLVQHVVCCHGKYWCGAHKKLYCLQPDGSVQKSFNLSHQLHSLLITPSLNEPITVYSNCTACWSHDPGGGAVSLLPDHYKETADLLWCGVDDVKLFSLLKLPSHDDQLLLSCLNTVTRSLTTALVAMHSDIISCIVLSSNHTLLVVQEGGGVDQYDITLLLSGSCDPVELTCDHLTTTTSKPLLACGVGTSHYAVLTDTSLDVYDGCYGTIVASSSLHTSVTTDTLLQLLHHGDHMILVSTRMVHCCSITLPTITSLSTVLGKGKRLVEQQPLLNMPPWKRARKDPSVWGGLIESSNQKLWEELDEMLQQLDDTNHTLHSALQQLASQLDSGREQLPQHVVTMVAEKCLSSKHTSHELLKFLLENGNFPSNLTGQLVDVAMETDNLSLLDDMLTHVHHIPEHTIVVLVTSFVERLQDSSQSTLIKPLLLKIFSCSCNIVILQDHLRKLSFQNSVFLLELLHDLLKQSNWTCTSPTYQQMVDWVSLIIDSHATQFVMTTNTRQLILDIHRTTGQKLRAMESLNKIRGPLELLQSRHSSNTKHQRHLYTIEWLNLTDKK
ncbi:uncharacterized protein [Dysidea avara]|uniref:uncharacterized protein n=1 Tax=Dysidea avara TaxID=196820 RepID=UPI00331698AC